MLAIDNKYSAMLFHEHLLDSHTLPEPLVSHKCLK